MSEKLLGGGSGFGIVKPRRLERVHEMRPSCTVDDDIIRVQIAVDNSAAMQCSDSCCYFDEQLQRSIFTEQAAALAQRCSFHVCSQRKRAAFPGQQLALDDEVSGATCNQGAPAMSQARGICCAPSQHGCLAGGEVADNPRPIACQLTFEGEMRRKRRRHPGD